METPSPVSSVVLQENPRKKFIVLGIVVALIYGFSTFLLAFTFLPVFFIFLSYFIGDQQNLVIVLTPLISTLSGSVAAFLSGRAAIRSAKESGSIWNAVIGTIVSIVVAFVGLLVFTILIYFIGSLVYDRYYELSAGAGIALISIAVTSGSFLAYGSAVIAGALVHYVLKRPSNTVMNKVKIEEGI